MLARILASSRGARRARRVVLRSRDRAEEQWDRWLLRLRPDVVQLDSVRRRLELLITAYYGRPIAVEAADAPPKDGWVRRYVLGRHAERDVSEALPRTDGERVLLPRTLEATSGERATIARYKLLALEQAERLVRGTVEWLPGPDEHPLVRELYRISEAAAIDARIAREIHGMRAAVVAAREEARANRRRFPHLTRAQRVVEGLVGSLLAAAPEETPEDVPLATTPRDSLAWAVERARRIGVGRRYEPVAPVHHWGRVEPRPVWDPSMAMPETDDVLRSLVWRAPALPFTSIEAYGGDGHGDGARLTEKRDGNVGVDESSGGTAGGGEADGRPSAPADAPIPDREHPSESDATTAPRTADGVLAGGGAALAHSPPPASGAHRYPEWDYVTARYIERAVSVRIGRVADGTPEWARSQMHVHATAIREIRQRFERLRARRVRLRNQLDGEELDIEACVRSLVARRLGHAGDERVYSTTRATRQPLAIGLLVDVSGSTGSPVGEGRRMIDIEKTALLLASEALAALGDRYGVLTFTGRGPHDVRVHTVKDFAESNGDAVRRRIAGLHPGGFTRLGAALRHATAALERERVRHRLLLVLSDGRPNDLGSYMADYGVEDSRQAINESRAKGIHPFCLNVDPEGPEYLARIFGPTGYVTLRRPEQLPRALLQAVRALIA